MNATAYDYEIEQPQKPLATKTGIHNRSIFRPMNILCWCLAALSLSLLINLPVASDAMDAPAFIEAVRAFPNHYLGKEVTVSGKVVSSTATKIGSGSTGYSIALDGQGGSSVLVVVRPESSTGLSEVQARFLNALSNGQKVKVRGTLQRIEPGKKGTMVCVIEAGEVV